MKIFLSLIYVSFSCALDSMNVSEEITIFSQNEECEEIINLQPKEAKAKAYQIKQVWLV